MKKTFIATGIVLLLLIVVASVALASPGQKQLLFKGSLHAVENNEVDWPTIYVHGTGSGNVTTLGKFSITYEGVVQNDENGVGTASPSAHFVAANGDSLFAEGTGVGTPTETPGVNKIVENYTITGGTGRFADATGNFTVERLINLATGETAGTLNGSIILP